MIHPDLRWRAVVLRCIYDISLADVEVILGLKRRSILRWAKMFETTGSVEDGPRQPRTRQVPLEIKTWIGSYVHDHPCFYLEELQEALASAFPGFQTRSIPTLCRILRHDLSLTRKILTRRAREARPFEIQNFFDKLAPFYSYPGQLLFLDETSKDARAAIRKYAWSARGTPAIVALPNSRGKRVSVLASFSSTGFLAWTTTNGTFDRNTFHEGFQKVVYPFLNPWPLPNSILILDNAKIHMYKELEDAVHQTGAILLYLPPYCPQLNPIEFGFGSLKKWIQRRVNVAFGVDPDACLEVGMRKCVSPQSAMGLYKHAGYELNKLTIKL
jgi:hypothetical protein